MVVIAEDDDEKNIQKKKKNQTDGDVEFQMDCNIQTSNERYSYSIFG